MQLGYGKSKLLTHAGVAYMVHIAAKKRTTVLFKQP